VSDPAPESTAPPRSSADDWIDDLIPVEVDWVDVVRRHPIPSLAAAALGGFLVGRLHGGRIVDSVSQIASERLNDTLERYTESLSGRG